MPRPYVGITDFSSSKEAERMQKVLLARRKNTGRLLMVGVMMSRKTLHGIETRWAKVLPPKETVASIFLPIEGVFNTIHYADGDGINVEESLELATAFGGANLHALQLDMIWPNPKIVEKYKRCHPRVDVVLQLSGNALDKVENNPRLLISRLRRYGNALDYVLLDKSSGRGLGMRAQELLAFLYAIAEHLPHLGIAAAGGLGPDTLDLARPLIEAYPALSLDAQGRLRSSGSALDPINWHMAERYLVRALEMLD